MGAKKRPFYRIVAIDSRRARDGKYLENLGTYNPITKPAEVHIFEDKMVKWFNDGAQPSNTVHALLSQIGFLAKYEKIKKGEEVAEVELKTTIKERPKKTRQMKKVALAKVEAAAKEAAEKAKAAEEAAKAAAEKAKADEEAAKAAEEAAKAPAEEAGDAPAENSGE